MDQGPLKLGKRSRVPAVTRQQRRILVFDFLVTLGCLGPDQTMKLNNLRKLEVVDRGNIIESVVDARLGIQG